MESFSSQSHDSESCDELSHSMSSQDSASREDDILDTVFEDKSIIKLEKQAITNTTITIKLTDGICEIPAMYSNAFSESSFTMCSSDVQSDVPLVFECEYLTKEECMGVVNVLRGEASIGNLNGRQHKFIDLHLLLPGCISSIQTRARQQAAKLKHDANKLQSEHMAFLLGKTNMIMFKYVARGYNEATLCSAMYASIDHIVPVQLTVDKNGIRMICICEGVPIWSAYTGLIPITSDNLYRTRTNSDGMCIRHRIVSKCLKEGGCTVHKKSTVKVKAEGNLYDPTMCTCEQVKSTTKSTAVKRPPRGSVPIKTKHKVMDTRATKLISKDGCAYMFAVLSTSKYCAVHFPHSAHSATQAKADAVMKILSKTCLGSAELGYMSGYVSLQ